MNTEVPSNAQSRALLERALRVIPEQTMTKAKAAANYPQEGAPYYASGGRGSKLICADGREFLDYTMGLGAFIFGYNHQAVDNAVRSALDDGLLYSLPARYEVELAEKLVDLLPHAEMVRVYKNGADVTGMAVRLARAHTGRAHIIQSGYHGHHDWYAHILRTGGILPCVTEFTHSVPLNDLSELERLFAEFPNQIAAFILEVSFDLPEEGYLAEVRRLCDRHGTVLVLDEMWTGFRVAVGGVAQRESVTPDLAVYSKGMASGFPISVITGRRDVMSEFASVWGFATFGSEAISLVAALTTIDEVVRTNAPDTLNQLGLILRSGLSEAIAGMSGIALQGYPCRLRLNATTAEGEKSLQRLADRYLDNQILWNRQYVVSTAHTSQDLEKTVSIARQWAEGER